MEALSLHTGETTLHWEDNTNYISVVESKRDTPRVKHTDIPVCFLLDQFDNGLFIPKYDNSSVMPADMFTKPFPVPIIIHSNKWMTGFIFYSTSETEHYQCMILHGFIVS